MRRYPANSPLGNLASSSRSDDELARARNFRISGGNDNHHRSATATTTEATTAATAATIVAVNADGDAVIVHEDGSVTLLHDGTGPDEPLPKDGPVVKIKGVDVTDDGAFAFVGLCCEPSPGTVLKTTPPTVATFESPSAFGHAPALSPDQTKLATITINEVAVTDLDFASFGFAAVERNAGTLRDVMWIDGDTIVVVVDSADTVWLRSFDLTADGQLAPGASSTMPLTSFTSLTAPAATSSVAFAGRADGVFYLSGLAGATLSAITNETLQPIPHLGIALPSAPSSAWAEDDHIRWIDSDRQLHLDLTLVAGEFIWVR